MEARKVLAVVLTHAAPDALGRCLVAIEGQSVRPDAVLVVDNASPEPVGPLELDLPVEVLHVSMNGGPAGGHAEGLARFLASDCDVAWVMDDDCIPRGECLETLLASYGACPDESIVLPWWIDCATGQGQFRPAWCGFLVARSTVEKVGLPRRELVWWAEDTEYVSWRMQQADVALVWDRDAEVEHDRVRSTGARPVWKVYYEARNTLYFRLYVQRGHTTLRMKRMSGALLRLLAQVIVDPDRRVTKLRAYCRGVADGSAKRLGLRMPLTSSS